MNINNEMMKRAYIQLNYKQTQNHSKKVKINSVKS